MQTVEAISHERRTRLSLILCRRAANETSRKLANHLVRAWFVELGIENCNCDELEKEGNDNGQIEY
jgi:hypothetical protein